MPLYRWCRRHPKSGGLLRNPLSLPKASKSEGLLRNPLSLPKASKSEGFLRNP